MKDAQRVGKRQGVDLVLCLQDATKMTTRIKSCAIFHVVHERHVDLQSVTAPIPRHTGPPCVPWWQGKQAFLNFLEAVHGDNLAPKRRKRILLNALGLEGQRIYYVAPTCPAPPPQTKQKWGPPRGTRRTFLNRHLQCWTSTSRQRQTN